MSYIKGKLLPANPFNASFVFSRASPLNFYSRQESLLLVRLFNVSLHFTQSTEINCIIPRQVLRALRAHFAMDTTKKRPKNQRALLNNFGCCAGKKSIVSATNIKSKL